MENKIPESVHKYLSLNGKKGGLVKSPAKTKAARANIKKRWDAVKKKKPGMAKSLIAVFLLSQLLGCASFNHNEDSLKYNYHEKQWSYQPQSSQLKYNYFENRWEWSR